MTKKIEVRIGILDAEPGLTHGSSVRVLINRNDFEIINSEIEVISVPISSLKVETNRTVVFTVDSENTLVSNEVVPSLVLGDRVVIEVGATPDMDIVSDARGLREGQTVNVK